jgi:hypothetical protein
MVQPIGFSVGAMTGLSAARAAAARRPLPSRAPFGWVAAPTRGWRRAFGRAAASSGRPAALHASVLVEAFILFSVLARVQANDDRSGRCEADETRVL